MLYLIVFLSGAVLMGLEMIGSRLLAPTFGTSIYVWGSLITVVMAALTLGYYLGGRLADRRPSLAYLGVILAVAGLLIGFLPFWSIPVNNALGHLEPRTGSLLAALIFFFLPSVLLATVSPYGVKLASRTLATIGNTAGRLSAISSAGSIVGTLVTSFFLIPSLGVRNIVHTLGLILLVLAVVALWYHQRTDTPSSTPQAHSSRSQSGSSPAPHSTSSSTARSSSPAGPAAARSTTLVIALALCLVSAAGLVLSWWLVPLQASPHPAGTAQTFVSEDTLYHHITVDQVGNERHLHFDRSYQSAMLVNDPLRMVFPYTAYLHLGMVARPDARRLLFIGLGAGSAPKRFLHDYPGIQALDVAEIDPEVVAIARRYFQLPNDPRLHVYVQDGRLFVQQQAARIAAGQLPTYDLAVVDAYFADAIPYHLTTEEFLRSLKATLSPRGIVVSNIIGALAGPHSQLLRAITRTFAAVFPHVYLFPVGGWMGPMDWEERNVILVATQSDPDKAVWTEAQWVEQARAAMESGHITEDVAAYASTLVEHPFSAAAGLSPLPAAPLLTDDYAPVDTLQHPL
ncbi:MAG: fused MFS/spermidine synthase [Limnochordaceae bacterium]|nr:fused MFS/spermidine synthase [Limnochordaceae bacterium]